MHHSISPDQIVDFFFLIVVVSGAAVLSRFVLWLYRRVPDAIPKKPQLSSMEQAYLIGGEVRVMELALFQLVRDGILKKNVHGFFETRFHPDSDPLSGPEFDLVQTVELRGAMSFDEILALRPRSLNDLRQTLVDRSLVLSVDEEKTCWIAATAPITVAFGYSLYKLQVHLDAGMSASRAFSICLMALALLVFARGRATHRTMLGDRSYAMLLRLSKTRDRESYDRVWKMKETVLFQGLRALGVSCD